MVEKRNSTDHEQDKAFLEPSVATEPTAKLHHLEPEQKKGNFLRGLLRAPKFGNPAKDRIAGLQYNILMGLFLASFIGICIILVFWSEKSIYGLGIMVFEMLLSALAFYWQRRGYLDRASWTLVSAMYLVFILGFSLSGFSFPIALLLALVISLTGLLLQYHSVIAVTVFTQATIWIFPHIAVMPVQIKLNELVYASVLMGLEGLLLIVASRALEKSFAEADRSTQDVIHANKDLQDITTNLEQRVEDRTKALGRQALQLQAATEVSRAVSSVLDADELIEKAVNLVRDRFDLYYVGLFLLDEPCRFAVLEAGTGEAGRQMLAGAHKLEVNEDSMIGWCITHKEARIALDVGKEAVRFSNPLLPDTRSELALPLVSQGQVIGAMTVQSIQGSAFTPEDITTLQSMADQLANGIEKARLYQQIQQRAVELDQAKKAADAAREDAETARLAAEAATQSLASKMWQITGQTHLNERMRGEQDVNSLANNIIGQLCEYIHADSGSIYIQDGDQLVLTGSYAPPDDIAQTIRVGSGLLGQAILSQKMLQHNDDLLENQQMVTSSLMKLPLKTVVIYPLVYEGKSIGAVEIGSFSDFSALQTEFLDKTLESVAVAFMTAQARTRVNELFAQTRKQAEELQVQEEELRATNEELESQTESLRASGTRLKANQAALEASNVELEEKTHILHLTRRE
jgi:GAF domain-containing protein